MTTKGNIRSLLPSIFLCSSIFVAAGSAVAEDAIPAVNADPQLHAMLPKKIQESGTITLATDAHYPPCEVFAEDNKTMIGYEPDLWNALAQKLGVKIEAVSINFDGLIPGVQSGRYDMAMECISDNAEREKQVIFIENAYATNAIYTLESNTTITADPLTLCGLKTATQKGTDFAELIKSLSAHCTKNSKPEISDSEFPSEDATLLALYSGRVDFVVNDYAAAEAMKKNAPKPIRLVINTLLPKYYNGIIVKRDNVELANALLAALKSLVGDGTYDKILEKWGLPELKLEDVGINLGTTRPLENPKP